MCSLNSINSPTIPLSHSKKGQIQVIFGPMFSGKTTELIRRCKRYEIANYKCVLVKYVNDQRYSNEEVATHDRQTLPAIPALSLCNIVHALEGFEVIGIDEGQFFPDVVEVSEKLANEGKVVIVAALDGNFKREAFGSILQLVPLAEHVIKLTAVCMQCYNDASFTKRKGEEKAIEIIGGADKYLSACRDCHLGKTAQRRDGYSQTPEKIPETVPQTCEVDSLVRKLNFDEHLECSS